MTGEQQFIDDYMGRDTWEIKENSNAHFSFGALKRKLGDKGMKEKWLSDIYSNQTEQAHRDGFFHLHDLGDLTIYCCGYSLKEIIRKGVVAPSNISHADPANHFSSILAQIANLTTNYQNEIAGAVAFSSVDTLLAPFIKEDGLEYDEVKQEMQEFVWAINSNSRMGSEPAFSNVTFDLTPPKDMLDKQVMVGGELLNYTYEEVQEQMDMLNRAFFEVMLEGDSTGAPHSYPIN